MTIVMLVAALFGSAPASGSVLSCTGAVFEDLDRNGRRDAGEPGVAGVGVYDGAQLQRTGPDGSFAFPWVPGLDGSHRLSLVKPAGYLVPTRADGLPDFWRAAADGCRDFALHRDPRPPGELHVLLFADPQTRDAREVGYYGRAIVDAVRRRHSAWPRQDTPAPVYFAGHAGDLGLTLGDVTNDDPALYPALNALTTSLGVPWLHAPGNHDIDLAAPDDAASLASFEAVYGPDTTAWEEHEAVFVVLDDVIWQPGEAKKYIGGLREDQFAFLEAYLATVNFQKRVVIAAHIPFFDAKPGEETFRRADRERLFALLQRFDQVLLLTGHGHVQRHHFHDADDGWRGAGPLHEYNVGAACGSYWGGVADADGIPVSTMVDGTPKGWAEMTIREHGDYSLRWNVAESGMAPDTGIALHAPQVLRRGSWPGFAVYANVFMGIADVRVEYRIDDAAWAPMQRVDKPDPRLVAENVRDDAATGLRGFDRLPEAAPSTHLWRGTLPTNLAGGEHRIEVRAYDPWRGELTAATTYRLLEPSP